ncbi:cbb3-type cytochrome c oxidase subunit 3 [Oxalobacteraceae bacterium R-40]|uniref:Cbb3-type cytochrome c oxidase subunit 3 n=1 Tax=Keguizhuia sedimenti TaxID=3064264 RepID=A0ABU1BNT5_9BURK|nr:cbb3-type cytochrome c oxidase subunit 3 [Oxalobacteraceae bacterium R-40]
MTIGSLIIDMRSVVTVASFITFLGIVWWAYSSRRRESFEQAAYLALNDDDLGDMPRRENKHG